MAVNNNRYGKTREAERRLQAAALHLATFLPPEDGVPNVPAST
jgi:hypothetical protein